jgi:Flp pilus assembly protein TadG
MILRHLRSRCGDDEGSASMEAVVLAVVLLLLILLAVAAGRTVVTKNAVADAAHHAARAASLQTAAGPARAEAIKAAQRSLTDNGFACADLTTRVDTAGYATPLGQPAEVRVEVSCTVSLSQLTALPGLRATRTFTDDFTSPLDQFRTRTGAP